MTTPSRDRLRELLDAVLDDDHRTLDQMADGAASSPFHFSRQLREMAGEPPVTMKRRVLLERAAWQLGEGASVTQASIDAGYDSVEGFSRAFHRAYGRPPSRAVGIADAWLPAPNGIHFHPPTSLWVHRGEQAMNPIAAGLVEHDLDDTTYLLAVAATVPADDLHRPILTGATTLTWDGPDDTLGRVLDNHVWTKEVWLASIEGHDQPDRTPVDDLDLDALADRHRTVAPRWLAFVRDVDRRSAWDDRLVDALCDPPESFAMGSVVTHVLTYAAHRRQLARHFLRALGHDVDQGDPIEWHRHRNQEQP